jgi:DNA-binding NarL/FixJ family response regulator
VVVRRLQILIADDRPEWRSILTHMLEPECDISGYAERGDEIVPLAMHLQPDVVTLDISMPGQSGSKALPSLRAALAGRGSHCDQHVGQPVYRDEAHRLGADDYVAKRSVMSDLMPAVRAGRVSARRPQRFA